MTSRLTLTNHRGPTLFAFAAALGVAASARAAEAPDEPAVCVDGEDCPPEPNCVDGGDCPEPNCVDGDDCVVECVDGGDDCPPEPNCVDGGDDCPPEPNCVDGRDCPPEPKCVGGGVC